MNPEEAGLKGSVGEEIRVRNLFDIAAGPAAGGVMPADLFVELIPFGAGHQFLE